MRATSSLVFFLCRSPWLPELPAVQARGAHFSSQSPSTFPLQMHSPSALEDSCVVTSLHASSSKNWVSAAPTPKDTRCLHPSDSQDLC
eukprot:NODE_13469_length_360_cov_2.585209_g12314_i0.p2 GENE.NODE_13469_length_360_cov_2.585209_g12314_i0~~NODE_13469_length_360_cov_2.585209_g12314_i0.p2  ORF type:complete len:88 (-),score=6.35 NODE_13469_length_360_cov_2.585209_g12314_i0:48-311(-)